MVFDTHAQGVVRDCSDRARSLVPGKLTRQVAHNEQYAARRYFVDCEHPVAGKVRMPGAPFIMSRTPWRIRSAAPRLGEHNLKILGERLGLAHGEIEAMATKAASLVTDAFHPLETGANSRQPSTRESPPPHGHR